MAPRRVALVITINVARVARVIPNRILVVVNKVYVNLLIEFEKRYFFGFLVCPDGTQAAGACVSGQCGAGFSCSNGLCCGSTSQTPKCLDGSEAIGACINCKCGTGYTCTTGNLCCPSTTNGKELLRASNVLCLIILNISGTI